MSPKYTDSRRRMLLDMHIPDWEPEFLSQYDPEGLADLYAQAGVTGVLFYCKSHLGQAYWPSPVGGIHPAAKDRDLVGEMFGALCARGIAPAAYHTVVFDNWAIENHPEWSVVPISTRIGEAVPWHGPRYGTACPANPDYQAYEHQQVEALLARYDFDVLWLDMTFWNAVCVCAACRSRFESDTGDEIPATIDWRSKRWSAFQAARERWLGEFVRSLYETARRVRPNIAVTHNFGAATHGWYAGLRSDLSNLDTFAAGDIYGGRAEQLVVSKLFQHLGKQQPAEFMTTRTPDLANHVELKSERQMTVEALATIAHNGAFLFIDAIDPRGTVNPGVYERVGRVFEQVATWESQLGGYPIADVAVYYSDDASILPADSGRSAAEATIDPTGDPTRKAQLPHIQALTSAAGVLQRSHIPFTIITKGSLGSLDRYRVLILSDVIRMDEYERSTIRDFVRGGGKVYASGRTSLLESSGDSGEGLALGDVFGVSLVGHEDGSGFYLAPANSVVAASVLPEKYLGHGFREGWVGQGYADPTLGLPRVVAHESTNILATLSLPYAYPSAGSMRGHDFASIHSSPPWLHLENPTIIEHHYGQGRAIYSVAPIERGGSETEVRVFTSLIESLLGDEASLTSQSDPDVWLTVADQTERSRLTVCALLYRFEPPTAAVPLTFSVRLPSQAVPRAVRRLSDGELVEYAVSNGRVHIDGGSLTLFEIFSVEYVL